MKLPPSRKPLKIVNPRKFSLPMNLPVNHSTVYEGFLLIHV